LLLCKRAHAGNLARLYTLSVAPWLFQGATPCARNTQVQDFEKLWLITIFDCWTIRPKYHMPLLAYLIASVHAERNAHIDHRSKKGRRASQKHQDWQRNRRFALFPVGSRHAKWTNLGTIDTERFSICIWIIQKLNWFLPRNSSHEHIRSVWPIADDDFWNGCLRSSTCLSPGTHYFLQNFCYVGHQFTLPRSRQPSITRLTMETSASRTHLRGS